MQQYATRTTRCRWTLATAATTICTPAATATCRWQKTVDLTTLDCDRVQLGRCCVTQCAALSTRWIQPSRVLGSRNFSITAVAAPCMPASLPRDACVIVTAAPAADNARE